MTTKMRGNKPSEKLVKSTSSKRDVWDKADIVAKFLSSVVIAVIGILITWQLQRTQIATNETIAKAQIEAGKDKEINDKKTEESKITIELLNHLISEKAVQRRIAIVALRQSVPAQVYDPIVQILATTDSDPDVRATAIGQLASGHSSEISGTLLAIANDPKRPVEERQLAAQGSSQVLWRTGNAVPTNVFIASSPGELLLDNNPFATVIATAFDPKSNIRDVDALANYVGQRVPALGGDKQHPATFRSAISYKQGDNDLPGVGAKALVVGISQTLNFPPLVQPGRDADLISAAFKQRGIDAILLRNPTRGQFSHALNDIQKNAQGKPLLLFYSGHAATSKAGAGWIASDSTEDPSTWILYEEVKRSIASSEASTNWLFIDAMYADTLFENVSK